MIRSSDDEFGIKPPHILEDNVSMIHITRADFLEAGFVIERSPLAPPASATKESVILHTLLASLYTRKYKRVRGLETEWYENQSKKIVQETRAH